MYTANISSTTATGPTTSEPPGICAGTDVRVVETVNCGAIGGELVNS